MSPKSHPLATNVPAEREPQVYRSHHNVCPLGKGGELTPNLIWPTFTGYATASCGIMHAPEPLANRTVAHVLKTHSLCLPRESHPTLFFSSPCRATSLRSKSIRLTRSNSSAPPSRIEPPPCPLACHSNMPDQWRWNEIPSYRLSKVDVEDYLKGLFGNYKFYTVVRHRA